MERPIAITGASGFFGFHLARELGRRGIPYRALVRSSSDVFGLSSLGAELVRADVTDLDSLKRAFDGCGAVVHLAGAADVADASLNERVNVDGTVNVAVACTNVDVPRLLFFSTNCAVRSLQDAYGQTKWRAEQALAHFADLDIRVFRPAMIYGEGSKEWNTFVRSVARLPVVPIPGDGDHALRPVFVDDAVAATVEAITRDGLGDRVYDILGPTPVTLNELIRLTAGRMGRRRRALHLPFGAVLKATELLGKVWTHPPVVPDQVLAFAQDTDGDIGPARDDLGFDPVPVDRGLEILFDRTHWKNMGTFV